MEFNISQRYLFDHPKGVLTDQLSDHTEIKLNSNENKILHLLVSNPKQVISRGEFKEHVWRSQGLMVHDSSLTQAISTLRKALGDSTKSPQYIMTVPKIGYQFIADVIDLPPQPKADESAIIDGNNLRQLAAIRKKRWFCFLSRAKHYLLNYLC